MGLDHGLYRKRYVRNWENTKPEHRAEVSLSIGGKPVALKEPTYIVEDIITWRKSNQIHNWFVQNVQDGEDDCKNYSVSLGTLKELHKVILEVLDDHSKASTLLPTQSGFFYGSTDYDEDYYGDLKTTSKAFFDALYGEDADIMDFEYWSSW